MSKRSLVITMIVTVGFGGIVFAGYAGFNRSEIPVVNMMPPPVTTENSDMTHLQQVTSLSPTVRPLTDTSDSQNQFDACVLTDGGYISGGVTHAGNPVPDNTFISLVFNGGPLQKTRTKDGFYSLPLLARECSDSFSWIDFMLWAGGKGQNVYPDHANYHLDIDLLEAPVIGSPDIPTCELILGTISGSVVVDNATVPDGTTVSAKIGPGAESLAQAVSTSGGRYKLTTVGVACENEGPQFLQMTLYSLETSIIVTPSQKMTTQDIVVIPNPDEAG